MSDESTRNDAKLPPPLSAWLEDQPPGDQRELEETWTLAGEGAPPKTPEEKVQSAWQDVELQLEDAQGKQRTQAHSTRRRGLLRHRRLLMAAALIAGMMLVGLWWWQRPMQVTAPAGEMEKIALPDGSVAQLNSASRLTYRRSLFGSEREVTLEGEAFFEVTRGKEPFTVSTFNATVKVLGTRFNVRAREDEPRPSTTVTVEEGEVALAGKGIPAEPVELRPGQMSRVTGGRGVPIPPEPAEAPRASVWKEGGLSVQGQSLGALARELERRFGKSIRIGDMLAQDTISLYLPEPESAEAILRDLCAYLGCSVQSDREGYVINKRRK